MTGENSNENAPADVAKEPERTYVLVLCPLDSTPEVQVITGTKQMLTALRKAYKDDSEQYAYVIQGELGQIGKTGSHLFVSFRWVTGLHTSDCWANGVWMEDFALHHPFLFLFVDAFQLFKQCLSLFPRRGSNGYPRQVGLEKHSEV